MGRELSPTLQEQQKWGLITRPYIKVELWDKWGGINRHRYSMLHDVEDESHLFEYYDTGDTTAQAIYNTHWNAQTFTPSTTHYINKVSLRLYRVLSPGIGTISIRATDVGGHPTGPDLTSLAVNWNTLTENTAGAWYNYSLPKALLTDGIKYAIVINAPDGNAQNYVGWRKKTVEATYPGGNKEASEDSGETWESHLTHDMMFREYGGIPQEDFDSPHAAAIPEDGSLIRARTVMPFLYGQRVTNPGPESDYTVWNTWAGALSDPPVAMASHEAKVALVFIPETTPPGTRWIAFRESTDNGANWGGWVSLGAFTDPITSLALAYDGNGDLCVLHVRESVLYRKYRVAGEWGAWEAWTNTLPTITGISVSYWGDWNVLITGVTAEGLRGIWTCVLGDGYSMADDTWSALADIIERGATETYMYYAPSVAFLDVYRCFFVERFTEDEAGYYQYWSHSLKTADYISNLWREPVPFNHTGQYGLALTHSTTHAYLTSASKVYQASLTAAGGEVTDDVLEIDFRQNPKTKKGYCKIVLDNTGGKYNSFNNIGWEVLISPGYYTSEGAEKSSGPAFWVTDYKFVSPPWYPLRAIYPPGVMGTLYIYTEDQWKMLKRWKARRKYSWAEGEMHLTGILWFLFTKIGLEFSTISYSSAIANFKPAFEMRRGYSAYWAVKKILSWVPDVLFFRGHRAYLKNPQADDAVYDTFNSMLGVTNLVFRGKYGTSAWEVNKAQVWGDTFRVERQDWDQIENVFDRLSRVTTPDYPDITRAAERALAELRTSEVETGKDSEMTCPTHCGLEPWDVIQVTDAIAGISNIKRRVLKIKWYFNRKHYAYHQKVTLGAP